MTPVVQVSSSINIDRGNSAKWLEVYRNANALRILMGTWKIAPVEKLVGDEFEAVRVLLSHIMASSGHFIDAVQTASTMDQLFDIHAEFLAVAKSRCPTM